MNVFKIHFSELLLLVQNEATSQNYIFIIAVIYTKMCTLIIVTTSKDLNYKTRATASSY